ncbi:TldD/PmbA family protein [Candidatus Woesearchaeota archaeon]|nr:TldD/PmbA family protein [Candidatus Woesearchaeota archaeon]
MNDVDRKIIEACERRIKDIMKISDSDESPFFASIRFMNLSMDTIIAENGSIERVDKDEMKNFGEVVIRVGDYDKGCGTGNGLVSIPQDSDPFSLEKHIHEIETITFNEARKDYLDNMSKSIGNDKEHMEIKYFSKEEPVNYIENEPEDKFNIKKWEDILREVSESFIKDDVVNPSVNLVRKNYKRYLINSEGTRIIDYSKIFSLYLFAYIEDKGILLESYKSFNEMEEKNLPNKEKLKEHTKKIIEQLYKIKNAPQQKSGLFPAVIDGRNHGIVWHEAIGHGSEAHRVDDEENTSYKGVVGKSLTLRDKIGDKITADFISVYDDPTDENLNGHYKYDAEGVPGQKVVIVKNGIFKNFLHSRETAGKLSNKLKEKIKSNGHARTYSNEDPLPRMSNTKVETEDKHTIEELYEMVIKECRKKGLDYGIVLKEAIEGYVNTDESYFHTVPKNVFRLYTNGRMELVKGVSLVDTPLQIINKIGATTDNYKIFRGHCDAESGLIPATETAPDAFVQSINIEAISRDNYQKFPKPLTKPPKRR